MKKLIIIICLLFSGCASNPKYNQNPDGSTRCRTIFDEADQFSNWIIGEN